MILTIIFAFSVFGFGLASNDEPATEIVSRERAKTS